MKTSKGKGMPRGNARDMAVEVIGPGKGKDSYMVGRSSNKMGEYGVEEGPMMEGEKKAREYAAEMQRESRGFKSGGMVNVRGQGKVMRKKGCKIC